MARWLAEEYPAIEATTRKEKALILWLDQTGLRSDSSVGKGWAPAGQPPVVPKTGKRFGVNVMAAISNKGENKGELYFTCYRESFTGPVFLAYLKRLTGHIDRKIHLIVGRHPAHRRVMIRDWLAENEASIEMHLMPGYAPELNPVELLNGDIKRHVAQANPGAYPTRGPESVKPRWSPTSVIPPSHQYDPVASRSTAVRLSAGVARVRCGAGEPRPV